MSANPTEEQIAQYADMFAAMGTEARLRIMRLLLGLDFMDVPFFTKVSICQGKGMSKKNEDMGITFKL